MSKLNKYISFFLLFASTLFIVPKEYLHELQHHTDTVDAHASNGETSVSNEHHHCDVLQLFVENFNAPQQHDLPCGFFSFNKIKTIDCFGFYFQPATTFLNRGPPSLH